VQPPTSIAGSYERVTVHGASLAGNLEGDSPERRVSVYLPPSYAKEPQRRYPVLYLLHGYTDSDSRWFGQSGAHFVNVQGAADRAYARGTRELIIVMPDAYTKYKGSMYSNSVTTGDWEAFVSEDLVAYVDRHYRTLPARASRGLAGHSMGGYGTIRIAMKYPDAFSSLYAMSACCLAANPNLAGPAMDKALAIGSAADLAQADFGTRVMIASAAAWSPDPKSPPLYLDLPVADGKVVPAIAARWMANAPLAMLDQYVSSLKQAHAIALDVGTKDFLLASIEELDGRMTLFGIRHTFETYDGNHISGIQERLEKKVIPFFSEQLTFASTK